MDRYRMHRGMIVAAILASTLLVSAAEPRETMAQPAPLTRIPETPVPTDLVKPIAQAAGIDQGEVARHLTVVNEANVFLNDSIGDPTIEKWFAGTAFSPDDSAGTLRLMYLTGHLDEATKTVETRFPYPDLVQLIPVRRTLGEIADTLDQLERDQDALLAEGVAGWTDDILRNGISLILHPDADPAVLVPMMESRYHFAQGFHVLEAAEAGELSQPSVGTCTSRNNCNPLRGGLKIHRPNATDQYCSVGFYAYTGSNDYLLTAGHCQINAFDMIRHSNYDVGGYVSPVINSGNADAVRLAIELAGWGRTASYYATAISTNIAVNSVFRGTYLSPNTPVCTYGARTGDLCGVVRSSNVTIREHSGMIGFSTCNLRGDSGGSVVNAYTAIAIVEGIYANSDSTGCYIMGTWATNAEQRLGTTIATR